MLSALLMSAICSTATIESTHQVQSKYWAVAWEHQREKWGWEAANTWMLPVQAKTITEVSMVRSCQADYQSGILSPGRPTAHIPVSHMTPVPVYPPTPKGPTPISPHCGSGTGKGGHPSGHSEGGGHGHTGEGHGGHGGGHGK